MANTLIPQEETKTKYQEYEAPAKADPNAPSAITQAEDAARRAAGEMSTAKANAENAYGVGSAAAADAMANQGYYNGKKYSTPEEARAAKDYDRYTSEQETQRQRDQQAQEAAKNALSDRLKSIENAYAAKRTTLQAQNAGAKNRVTAAQLMTGRLGSAGSSNVSATERIGAEASNALESMRALEESAARFQGESDISKALAAANANFDAIQAKRDAASEEQRQAALSAQTAAAAAIGQLSASEMTGLSEEEKSQIQSGTVPARVAALLAGKKKKKEELETLAKGGVPVGEDTLAHYAQQMGVSTDIARALYNQSKPDQKGQIVGQGETLVDPKTGLPIYAGAPKPKNFSIESVTNLDGTTSLVRIDKDTGQSFPITPGEASSLISGAPSSGQGSQSSGTAAERNNNPGNIKVPAAGIEEARKRYNDPGAQIGSQATDGGYFIKFSDVNSGANAIPTLLKIYGPVTPEMAFRKWSNNAYGREILPAEWQNVSIDKIPNEVITTAIMKREDLANYNANVAKNGTGVPSDPSTSTGNPDLDRQIDSYAQDYLTSGTLNSKVPQGLAPYVMAKANSQIREQKNSLKRSAIEDIDSLIGLLAEKNEDGTPKVDKNGNFVPAGSAAIGPIHLLGGGFGDTGQTVNTKIESLKAKADLNNAQYLKGQGALSDGERRILTNVTGLSKYMNETVFLKKLADLKKQFEGQFATQNVNPSKEKDSLGIL